MRKLHITTFCCVLLLCGCGSAFRVHEVTSDAKLDGIPFYAKSAKCVQSSVYLYPYYRITFQTLSGDKVLGSLTATLSAENFKSTETQTFLSILRKKPPLSDQDIAAASDAWTEIEKHNEDPYLKVAPKVESSGKLTVATAGEYLIANTAAPKVLVDYGHQYALNAKSPFAGSVNADYKINQDGTLSETSAQIQEQTFATIASLFPVSDLIKTAAGVGTKAAMAIAPEAPATVALQATVEKRALKITYSETGDFNLGCSVPQALTTATDMTIEDIGPETTSGKDEKNAITVTGKIVLPSSSSKPGSSPGAPTPGAGQDGAGPKTAPPKQNSPK